jgi:hypothetical protein
LFGLHELWIAQQKSSFDENQLFYDTFYEFYRTSIWNVLGRENEGIQAHAIRVLIFYVDGLKVFERLRRQFKKGTKKDDHT